ncbi:MAG: HPr kinase/phosphorylase, partial [Oscillospiraceae bacterium]|nr:HPr kinase/phosphorylase [Oscillospiraceae bacterium]
MSTTFSVKLSKIISTHNLSPIYMPRDASEIEIAMAEVNRPGLQLAGFYDFFDNKRVQIFGKNEFAYLEATQRVRLRECFRDYFSHRPIATVVARNLTIFPEMIEAAKEFGCPLLTTDLSTSEFMSGLISTLNVELAPRITRHGVLVEVLGEGILLMGESGVGKSETAMELVKRGHRLIADDAVEIRRVSARTLVGSSPENIRHFMELRGIGII